jgi:SPP1 gp7 family putative phage head morphogenesis protein
MEPWELGKVEGSLKAADKAREALLKELQALVDRFIPRAFREERREAFSRGRSPQVVLEEGMSSLQERPLTAAEERMVRALTRFTYETYRTVAAEWHGRVRTTIALGVLRGDDMRTVSRRIREQTGVRLSDAERIARTETARVSQAARMGEYQKRRVEKLDWILADRPCTVCEDIARGSPYERDKVPALPVHPHCMCAVAPVIEELPEPPPPEKDWEPRVINAGYSELERARINRLLDKLPQEDKERMMGYLASEEHCPVILRPEDMRRRLGFDAEAKYGRDYRPYVDWAGLYEPSTNRVWVLPEYRDHALVHEIGHQYYWHGVSAGRRSSLVLNRNYELYQKAKAAGRAVTDYALTNEREYFAEGVKFFIQDPRRLHQRDIAMYRFLNEQVFPGTYKRLPRPGAKLQEVQVG